MTERDARKKDLKGLYEQLEKFAAEQNVEVVLLKHLAQTNGGLLTLPVRLPGVNDAYEIAVKLQDLEDAWNNQEPRPGWNLVIYPSVS